MFVLLCGTVLVLYGKYMVLHKYFKKVNIFHDEEILTKYLKNINFLHLGEVKGLMNPLSLSITSSIIYLISLLGSS